MREIAAMSLREGKWFGGEENHIGEVGQRISWFRKRRTVLRQSLGGEGTRIHLVLTLERTLSIPQDSNSDSI